MEGSIIGRDYNEKLASPNDIKGWSTANHQINLNFSYRLSYLSTCPLLTTLLSYNRPSINLRLCGDLFLRSRSNLGPVQIPQHTGWLFTTHWFTWDSLAGWKPQGDVSHTHANLPHLSSDVRPIKMHRNDWKARRGVDPELYS